MDFDWPIPPEYNDHPIWTGGGFQIGSEKVSILRYTQCDVGWDASLTNFHEKEAEAGHHYIDKASRLHARLELDKNVPNKSAVVLEIGSSSGYLLGEIKKSVHEIFLIGSDCIPEPLENIAKKIPDIPLIEFDLVNCPLPNNCVDVIIALNVLEHIKNDEIAIQQIYRILKPGGYAIIEVPANQELFDFYDEQLKHFRRYDLHDLSDMARKSKLNIICASHLGFFIYPIFKFMKLRNKRRGMKNDFQKQTSMKNLIHLGGPLFHKLLFFVMRIELFLGKYIQYPIGIRCLMTLKKVQ